MLNNVQEEIEEHLESINDNSNEIQANFEYLQNLDTNELLTLIKNECGRLPGQNARQAEKLVDFAKPRASTLLDFLKIEEELKLLDYDPKLLIWKNTSPEATQENLRLARELLRNIVIHEFKSSNLTAYLMPVADTQGRGAFLWPLEGARRGAFPRELVQRDGRSSDGQVQTARFADSGDAFAPRKIRRAFWILLHPTSACLFEAPRAFSQYG